MVFSTIHLALKKNLYYKIESMQNITNFTKYQLAEKL